MAPFIVNIDGMKILIEQKYAAAKWANIYLQQFFQRSLADNEFSGGNDCGIVHNVCYWHRQWNDEGRNQCDEDSAKFLHFCKLFKVKGKFLQGWFSIWQNFEPTLALFLTPLGNFSSMSNGQILNKQCRHLVTLGETLEA